jgi:hypothetical protein
VIGLVCAASPAAAENKLWAGGDAGVMTLGKLTPQRNDLNPKDSATAFTLGANARYGISSLLSVGVGARITFGVDSLVLGEGGNQLDARARLAVGKAVAARVKAYGFVSPGYTVIYDGNLEPSGFLVDVGAGAAYALGPGIALTAELGLRLAFLSYEGVFETEEMTQRYVHLTVGFVVPIR